jgi:hypothetical protein
MGKGVGKARQFHGFPRGGFEIANKINARAH